MPVASETCANAPQKLGKNAKNAKFQDALTPKLSKIVKNAKFQDLRHECVNLRQIRRDLRHGAMEEECTG